MPAGLSRSRRRAREARARFERGIEGDLGVALYVLGSGPDAVYVTVFVPHDERDAESRMICGLKLGLPGEPRHVREVSLVIWERAAAAQPRSAREMLDDRLQTL
jgi:hypothetical protein